MAKGFSLSIVMKAVDKATAPIRAVAKAADKAAAPFKKLQAINNKVRITWDRMGGGKITSSFKKVQNSVGGLISKTAKFVGGLFAMQGAIGGVVGAVYRMARASSDYGDSAWKTSQKIGMNVEAWQELRHAAEMSGIEGDSMGTMLAKLNKRLAEAASGSEEATKWFKRAGIAVTDSKGRARSAESVFMDLADVFEKHRNGTKKTALAMGLFEEEGTKLIPLLNSGKKGIEKMRQEARDLGIVMDEKTAKASEAFNDNVSRMIKVVKGLAFNLGSQLIPIFNDLVVSIKAWIEQNRELIKTRIKEWVDDLKKNLPELKEKFFKLINGVKDFITTLSDVVEKLGGFENILKIVGVYLAGSFIASLASAAYAVMGFGVALMTNPAGWILLGIATAAMAVFYAFKHWDGISGVLKSLLSGIVQTVGEIFCFFADVFVVLPAKVILMILKIGAGIINGISSIWKSIMSNTKSKINGLLEFLSGIDLFEIGSNILTSLGEGMKSAWAWLKGWFDDILKSFKIEIPQPVVPSPRGPLPITPLPLLPKKPEPFKPFGKTAADGGLGLPGQPAKAAVQIDFLNVPKGTNIKTKSDKGTDLGMKVKMGPAMATN
ncbi:hypothetical protein [Cloacibacillus porcorum]|uniref:hypothetical protein n=1 Tax=Cloacibacillus porcorum TaxID=1197717 RepID=UPI00267387EF|nr:hypothetical protein [Cloacibacillus porcorum]